MEYETADMNPVMRIQSLGSQIHSNPEWAYQLGLNLHVK